MNRKCLSTNNTKSYPCVYFVMRPLTLSSVFFVLGKHTFLETTLFSLGKVSPPYWVLTQSHFPRGQEMLAWVRDWFLRWLLPCPCDLCANSFHTDFSVFHTVVKNTFSFLIFYTKRSKNLLVYYCRCCNMIGYATRYLNSSIDNRVATSHGTNPVNYI